MCNIKNYKMIPAKMSKMKNITSVLGEGVQKLELRKTTVNWWSHFGELQGVSWKPNNKCTDDQPSLLQSSYPIALQTDVDQKTCITLLTTLLNSPKPEITRYPSTIKWTYTYTVVYPFKGNLFRDKNECNNRDQGRNTDQNTEQKQKTLKKRKSSTDKGRATGSRTWPLWHRAGAESHKATPATWTV